MKQAVEDALNLGAFVLMLLVSAPIYIATKLVEWIKGK